MLPSSHQLARFFASAKAHKFDNLSDINVTSLKLRPIIDYTGTCYYKTGKVISKYLKPLTKNEFVINNTQDFPTMLSNMSLYEDEEDVSYDVESLFTNIPIKDTIDFICGGNICTQETRTNLQKIYIQETTLQTHNGMYI